MDVDSRKYYRRQVALIAAKTRRCEEETAQAMLEQCLAQTQEPKDSPRRQIGYPILHSPYLQQAAQRKITLVAGILPLCCADCPDHRADLGCSAFSLWEVLHPRQGAMAGWNRTLSPHGLQKAEGNQKVWCWFPPCCRGGAAPCFGGPAAAALLFQLRFGYVLLCAGRL